MGCCAMFCMETWVSVWRYPLNIAGPPVLLLAGLHRSRLRVDDSLVAGLSAAFGMLRYERTSDALSSALQRAELPRWRDTDKFFLCLEATDPKFSSLETRRFWKQHHPVSVVEVDH